ncbi:hypothetical protein [Bradyrhizobium sp. SYSU BS000235]|uniref:hypothetical protein n=1 Tax=Bradyrhizobium sp. SYSU BS000235 TaxID=3411332 RepID=UPI003C77F9B3
MQGKALTSIVVILTALGYASAAGAAASLRSGFYEGVVLAVGPTGRVVGHFDMEQGDGATKRCVFDFVGEISGNQAIIHTVQSPNLSGRITVSRADEVMFSMAHVRDLPGCGLVLPPEAEAGSGIGLDRIRSGSWTDLARVRNARVAFKAAADGAAGRTYVVKGDVVGILAQQGNQVQVVYPTERDNWAQGWVAAADLAPLAP